jgi:hypothetical protein
MYICIYVYTHTHTHTHTPLLLQIIVRKHQVFPRGWVLETAWACCCVPFLRLRTLWGLCRIASWWDRFFWFSLWHSKVIFTFCSSLPQRPPAPRNPDPGCNDAFVEVGMPRSPSHSGNAGDLKQMLGASKVSCAKRQTVELLQGTKNSHLQYVCLSCWRGMMEGEFALSSLAKTLTQVRLESIIGFAIPPQRYLSDTQGITCFHPCPFL